MDPWEDIWTSNPSGRVRNALRGLPAAREVWNCPLRGRFRRFPLLRRAFVLLGGRLIAVGAARQNSLNSMELQRLTGNQV